jgi:malate dehydrogenase
MTTVGIVGAGDLGGAIAQALVSRDRVNRILFVDASSQAAAGKALDIQQSGAVDLFHTKLDGTDDISRLTGCAVCVVADRFGAVSSEWRGEDGLAMLGRIAPYVATAPLIFAGAGQGDLLAQAAGELQMPRTRLIGASPEALASSITAIVAVEASCSPRDVRLTVLGTPGAFVVPWSEASIGGYALDRVLSQVQLSRIEARAAKLWPPGPYTLAAAAATIVHAILSSSRQSFSVLTQLGGEFGVRNRVGAVPARFSPRGIAETRTPELTPRERVQLQTALGG